MKKIISLIILEIIIVLSTFLTINLYIFQKVSISLKPIIFLVKFRYQSNLLSMPLPFILMICAVIAFLAIQFVFMYQVIRKTVMDVRNKSKGTQGTAKWAEDKDLKKAGLITKTPAGIVLGQSSKAKATALELDKFKINKTSDIIADDSPYHTLVAGATGAGKFVGIIGPTLLNEANTNKSIIVVDPKSESYRITGGFRSKYSDVYYFNPLDKESCGINILDYIPLDTSALSKIKNICNTIHPDKSKEPYWDMCPRQILEMLIGHVLLRGVQKSLPEVSHLISSSPSYAALFQSIINEYTESPVDTNSPLYPVAEMILSNANHYLEMAKSENADQLSTHFSAVMGDLSPYSTPEAEEALRYSDFSLSDICDGKRPITLYMCCDVDNLPTIMPMFKLIFSLVIRSMLHEEKHKYKVWLILDEFSQFEKFEIVQKQITYVRSFGIRIIAFIQSIAQLKELYGHDGADALLDNFQIKVYLKANTAETGQYFERMLGKKTILQKKTSFSSNRKNVGVDGWTENASEIGRSLLTADEILRLPSYEELIFHPNIYPYRGKKVQYFSDARFKKLMNLPIKAPEEKPKLIPDLRSAFDSAMEKAAVPITIDATEVPEFSVTTPDDTPQSDDLAGILEQLRSMKEEGEVIVSSDAEEQLEDSIEEPNLNSDDEEPMEGEVDEYI